MVGHSSFQYKIVDWEEEEEEEGEEKGEEKDEEKEVNDNDDESRDTLFFLTQVKK